MTTPKKTKKTTTPAQKPAKQTKTIITPAKESKKRFSLPPLFPPETTREDKLCLLSFCLGMIAMASFFVIDFQIRSYFEMRRWEDRVMYALQNHQSLNGHKMNARGGRVISRPAVKNTCPPIQPRKAAFIESEYAPYALKGDGEISGNFCDALPKGAKCPAKVSVFVNPVTTYSTEWWTRHWTGRTALSQGDPRALKYNTRVNTEPDGDFEFDNLAAGSYYVAADACVVLTAGKPCVPVRLGKKVTLKEDAKITLDLVFRADKP